MFTILLTPVSFAGGAPTLPYCSKHKTNHVCDVTRPWYQWPF